MTRLFPVTLVFVSALSTGCTPSYDMRVPDSMMSKLPYESRIELLEAENALAVAIDKVDESQNEILRMRDGLRRAKDRLDAAGDEVGRASDATSREVADLAVIEARARVVYLRARQRVNVGNEDVVEMGLKCALAEYEAARLQVARKAKVQGAESLSPQAFDQQVKGCHDYVAQMKKNMKEDLDGAKAAKDKWEEAKVALARKTFDARASPFVE